MDKKYELKITVNRLKESYLELEAENLLQEMEKIDFLTIDPKDKDKIKGKKCLVKMLTRDTEKEAEELTILVNEDELEKLRAKKPLSKSNGL